MTKQPKDNSVNVGEIYSMEITGLTTEGKGVGRVEGMAVFVAGALPGERVLVRVLGKKRRYAWGEAIDMVTASAQRVMPRCPVAMQCGGCQLSHLDEAGQLAAKEDFVRQQLSRIGGVTGVEILPIIGADTVWGYRNRVYLHYDEVSHALGFFAPGSKRVVPISACSLASVQINQVIASLQQHIGDLREIVGLHHVLIKESNVDGRCLVAFLCEGTYQPDVKAHIDFLRQEDLPIASLWYNYGQKTPWDGYFSDQWQLVWGQEKLLVSLLGKQFRWGAKDFLQVNFCQTERLYGVAREMLAQLPVEVDYLWDIYCGIGTIGICLASPGQTVIGVEVVPEAVESAKENALLNQVEGHYFAGLCEEVLPSLLQEGAFAHQAVIAKSVAVLDPPRSGCEEAVLAAIAAAGFPYLVYISCHGASLARDVKRLEELGYRLESVQPVDLFPQTAHVENVCLFSRK
ncbi:MAG: 23S rRNA (uracil(1939)-C(5))-methyltransferase RlmD [Peptococcaceae bacterium]|jgi:23S rRNA (uracil1939-C5)-methyltransferase|nr:23S rRNA (uracil(1939)-C(5))-methyltransferase RlmD [Peptococcaceae bacterium]